MTDWNFNPQFSINAWISNHPSFTDLNILTPVFYNSHERGKNQVKTSLHAISIRVACRMRFYQIQSIGYTQLSQEWRHPCSCSI